MNEFISKLAKSAFFSSPMRIFFVSAFIFGIIGSFSFFMDFDYISFHKFFFINLLSTSAYAGFLLVALPDWANYQKSLRNIASLLYFLIILAFLLFFFSNKYANFVIFIFWACLFSFSAFLMIYAKNDDNLDVLLVLGLITGFEFAYFLSENEDFLNAQVHISVAAIILISFRISVVLGREALKSSKLKDPIFIPNQIYKNIASFVAILYAFSLVFLPQEVSGFLAISLGFLLLAKLRELHHLELLCKFYLRFYYILEFIASLAYIWLGFLQINDEYSSAPLHLIAITFMFGFIYFVFIVAGLRHSGFKNLLFPKLSYFGLILLVLAGILRAVLPDFDDELYILAPSIMLILAFVFYLVNFIKIFIENYFSDDPE